MLLRVFLLQGLRQKAVAERLALLSVSGKVKDCVVDIDYLLVVKFYILSNIPF